MTRVPPTPEIQTHTIRPRRQSLEHGEANASLKRRHHIDGSRATRLLAENMKLPQTTLLPNRDLAFVGMPGEPFVEFQMQLRSKSPCPIPSCSATRTATSPTSPPSPRPFAADTARTRPWFPLKPAPANACSTQA